MSQQVKIKEQARLKVLDDGAGGWYFVITKDGRDLFLSSRMSISKNNHKRVLGHNYNDVNFQENNSICLANHTSFGFIVGVCQFLLDPSQGQKSLELGVC